MVCRALSTRPLPSPAGPCTGPFPGIVYVRSRTLPPPGCPHGDGGVAWFEQSSFSISPRPRVGAVSFLDRFGSGLNRHAHLHAAVTDGVFLPGPHGPDGPPAFLPARPLTQPGASGVIELSPFEFLAPACGSHPTAAEAPASLSRSVCAEPPAAAGRHGSGGKGMSGSSAMPRLAGMRATTTPREDAATRTTRTKSLAPTTPPGLPGPS